MIQVLERAPKRKSSGEKWAEGLTQFAASAYEGYQGSKSKAAKVKALKGFGIDATDFDTDTLDNAINELTKQQAKVQSRKQQFGNAFQNTGFGFDEDIPTGNINSSEHAGETPEETIVNLEKKVEGLQGQNEDIEEREENISRKEKSKPKPVEIPKPKYHTKKQIGQAYIQDGPQAAAVLQRDNDAMLAQYKNDVAQQGNERQFNFNEKKYAEEKQAEKTKLSTQERRKIHEESAEYDKRLINETRAAKNQLSAIKTAQKSIDSGKIQPKSLANIFTYFGDIGKRISNALLKKDEAVLQSLVPDFLEGRKELFGVRLSDADLAILQDKLPDISKSLEANQAVLKIMKRQSELALIRNDVAKNILEANEGYRPIGYERLVETRFDEMTSPVWIITPNGNEIEIPAFKVGSAIKQGAKLANE